MKSMLIALVSLASLWVATSSAPAQERMRVGMTSLAPTTLPAWAAKRL
jgi:hypothetical protein